MQRLGGEFNDSRWWRIIFNFNSRCWIIFTSNARWWTALFSFQVVHTSWWWSINLSFAPPTFGRKFQLRAIFEAKYLPISYIVLKRKNFKGFPPKKVMFTWHKNSSHTRAWHSFLINGLQFTWFTSSRGIKYFERFDQMITTRPDKTLCFGYSRLPDDQTKQNMFLVPLDHQTIIAKSWRARRMREMATT